MESARNPGRNPAPQSQIKWYYGMAMKEDGTVERFLFNHVADEMREVVNRVTGIIYDMLTSHDASETQSSSACADAS